MITLKQAIFEYWTANITPTSLTSLTISSFESIGSGHTWIALITNDMAFTVTKTSLWITWRTSILMQNTTIGITFTLGTSIRIIGREWMIAWFTLITSRSSYISLAVTFTSNSSLIRMSLMITDSTVGSSLWITITCNTHILILQIFGRVMKVSWFTSLTMIAFGVMLTLITVTTGDMSSRFP